MLPEEHIESLRKIEDGYWWFRGRVYWAKELIRPWYEGRASREFRYADLGCGTGGFAREIQREFRPSETLLVDKDERMFQTLADAPRRQKLLRDFTTREEPILDGESVDLVTCMDVLEHLEEDGSLLAEIHRILKPNGLVLISVPALSALHSEWDRTFGHYRRYDRDLLRCKLEQAGFQGTELKYMWSFLLPAGFYRKARRKYFRNRAEFASVPTWLNSLLFRSSQWEWKMTSYLSAPFGTSLMACAQKR